MRVRVCIYILVIPREFEIYSLFTSSRNDYRLSRSRFLLRSFNTSLLRCFIIYFRSAAHTYKYKPLIYIYIYISLNLTVFHFVNIITLNLPLKLTIFFSVEDTIQSLFNTFVLYIYIYIRNDTCGSSVLGNV